MAKWKCEICGNEFENFHAQGFDSKIYCPLCYFKRKNQELKEKIKKLSQWDTDKDTRNSRQRVANAKLLKENQKLKKQVEEYKKQLKPNYYVKGLEGTLKEYQQEMNKVAIQQKEFIKYLNSYIDLLNDKPDMLEETQKDILEEILQKYKEIIGGSDDKK